MKKNKILNLVLLTSFLSFSILPFYPLRLEAADFTMSTDFLIEMGISFFDQGRVSEAIQEFKKALIIDPNSEIAREFLRQIEKELRGQEKEISKGVSKELSIEQALDDIQKKRDLLKELPASGVSKEKGVSAEKKQTKQTISAREVKEEQTVSIVPERTIILNEEIKNTQPNTLLELAKDSTVIIKGDNIKRFLNLNPDKLEITRIDENNLLIKSKGIGSGILHIWDSLGRWTFNFKGVQSHLTAAYKEEYERKKREAQLSEPFKINYSFDWGSFSTGRRLDTTERRSLFFNQSFGIRGETPYGKYDSSATLARLNKENQLDNLTMGLSDGHFWGLSHIDLRIFNVVPAFSAYKFPSILLRGAGLDVPMFNNAIHYALFWGGIPEGNYTRLSPGLGRTKDAYLEGVGLQYKFSKNARYKFYYAHTYGTELNQPVLTDKAFGLGAFYKIGKFNFDSEIAYDDADHISYTTGARLSLPKTSVSLNFTEEDRDFASPFGGSTTGGSSSARMGINFNPTTDISISNNFSAIRDRRLFNPSRPKRLNYTFDTDGSWRLDPHTTMDFGYTRDDTKGSVSPSITQTRRLGIRKQIFFIKKLGTYLTYLNSRSKYFTGSTSNYDRNSLTGGLSFSLIGDLYASINKGINFIENRMTKESAHPHTMETSLSYYSRIFTSPFYSRFRVTFRDEEEAGSSISFLSGEDRLEFFTEFDYKPNPYINGYLSFRVANIWAETADTSKHLDAEVRYGLRIVWDTGFRWNTKGHIEGYVFDDLDGDGVKGKDEAGIKQVKISSTGDKSDTTNDSGYYKIKNIIGKKAEVSVDMNTVPKGYILTTESSYEIDIVHAGAKQVDFGLTTHSEIAGVVFVDKNGNNRYDRDEKAVGGVAVNLSGIQKTIANEAGQFLIRNLSAGQYTLEIDLNTIPTEYIPNIPLKKTIEIQKGETFFFNIPLRASSQTQ